MATQSLNNSDLERVSLLLCKASAIASCLKTLTERDEAVQTVQASDLCTNIVVMDDLVLEAKGILDGQLAQEHDARNSAPQTPPMTGGHSIFSASTLQRVKGLSLEGKIQIHEWCRSIFDASTFHGNMPRAKEEASDLANEIFTDLAGELMEIITGQLKATVPQTEREAILIAEVLIPYHLSNEGLTKAAAVAAKLVDSVHGLRSAA